MLPVMSAEPTSPASDLKHLEAPLRDDVRNRTETAQNQAQCFRAMELALEAHRMAQRLPGERPQGGTR